MRKLLPGTAAARGCALGRARMRLPHRLEVEVSEIAAAAVDATPASATNAPARQASRNIRPSGSAALTRQAER